MNEHSVIYIATFKGRLRRRTDGGPGPCRVTGRFKDGKAVWREVCQRYTEVSDLRIFTEIL